MFQNSTEIDNFSKPANPKTKTIRFFAEFFHYCLRTGKD